MYVAPLFTSISPLGALLRALNLLGIKRGFVQVFLIFQIAATLINKLPCNTQQKQTQAADPSYRNVQVAVAVWL